MSSRGAPLLASGDNEESVDITFDDILKRIKNGLFGVLFITNKNSDHNITWHFLETFIDHLQDLAFPLCFTLAPWQIDIEWLQTILRWFSPERMIQNTPIVFNILLAALGAVMINALWVGYSFSQNRFRFIWTLKLLRVTLALFATVLYNPFLSFFTVVVVECGDTHDLSMCWTSAYILKSVATVFVITLFIILALSVNVTFFEPDPKVKDMTSRPHSRLDLLYLACRTILTVLTIVLETYGADRTASFKKTTAVWIMAITCVVSSMLCAFSFVWYIPYYNFRYAVFRAALMMNFFWASLCFLFTVLRPYSDIGIIYIVLAPVSLMMAGFLVIARRRVIERIPVASITDPLTLELHIRFRLLDAGLLYRDVTASGTSPSDMESGGNVKPRGSGQGGAISGISIGGARHVNSASTEKEMRLMDDIVEAFVIATKNMSKSCMLQIFAGAFYLIHLNNRAQCLATYTRAEALHPRMDEAFMIYRRQQLLNERFSGGDVIDFIAFEQNMQLARKYEKKATLAVIHFWSELLKKQPSFQKLQSHGAAISFAISSAQSHFMALIKLSPDAPHVYRLYGNFLISVLNDAKQGQDLLDHADELEEEHNKVMDEMDADGPMESEKINLDLLSEDNVIITLSGELNNLGHIINANAMATKVFGYKRQELMNQNVNKLLPSPFSESHDMFLKRYLETGFAKVVDSARQVLGLNKQGFLFPITLCVKHIVDTKGAQSFIGIIKPQPESDTQGFIIMSSDLEILHFTKNIGTLFNAKPIFRGYDEIEQRLKITEWIPSITSETTSQFLAKSGMRTQHMSNGVKYEIVMHGDNVQVTGVSCFICRIKFKKERVAEENGFQKENAAMDTLPIAGGCPFSEWNSVSGRRPSFVTSPHVELVQEENLGSNGSVEMPMSFSARGSKEHLAQANSVPTIQLSQAITFPQKTLSRKGSDAGKKTPISSNPHVKRTAVMSEPNGPAAVRKTKGDATEKGRGSIQEEESEGNINPRQDDAESQGSRTSRGTSAKSYMKRIITLKNEKSNRRLQVLNYSFGISMSFLAIIATVECVEFRKLYESANAALSGILYQNEIAVKVVQVANSVRSLDLNRVRGWFWSSAKSYSLEQDARESISAESYDVRSAAGVVAFCGKESAQLVNSDGTRSRPIFALEAVSSTISSSRYLMSANLRDANFIPETAYVLQNVPYEVLRVVNACSTANRAESFRIGRSLPVEVLAYSAVGPILCVILLLCVIQPLYMRIEDNKERFLRMFYDIPKEVVKGIYESHLQRVMSNDDDNEDPDADLANKFALEKVLGSIDINDKTMAGQMNAKSSMKRGKISEDSKIVKNPLMRWITKATHDHHRVCLKTFAIFITTTLYFFVIGGLSYFYLANVDDIGSGVYWSSQRQILMRKTTFFVREVFIDLVRNISLAQGIPAAETSVPLNSISILENAVSIMANWTELDNAVLYGNSNYGIAGILSFGYSSPQVTLEMQNACVAASPADCYVFDNGVMARGIHSASSWYRKRASNILANITMARSASNVSSILRQIDESLDIIRNMDYYYLFPAYEEATKFYLANIRFILSWFSSFNLAFTITYILLLLMIYLFLIRPLIRALGDDLRRTAALVYMLPTEVFIKDTPIVFNILLSALGLVLINVLWVGYSFSQNRFRLAFCVKATFFEPDPKKKDISSRPHSRLDLLYLACRTVLTIATIILEVYGESHGESHGDFHHKINDRKRVTAIWVFAVLCVLASMTLAFGFIWYIPYYNFRYAMFRSGLMLNFLWASLAFLYTVLRPESDIGIVYMILSPLTFILAIFLVTARRQAIETTPVSSITDPFVLELQIRFRLIHAGLLYSDSENSSNNRNHDIESGGHAVDRGGPGNNAVSGISIGGYRQVAGSADDRDLKLMDDIVEAFVTASRNIPKSCMLQLFAGAFHLIHLNNRAQCLATYTKAEALSPRLDEAFMIYRRQRLLNERFAGGDFIDFIAYEQNMQLARKYEAAATLAVIHFWAELLKRQPSFWKLQSHGATISHAVSSAQTKYQALIKLSPNSANVYRCYGNFLMNVLNDSKQGQDLLDYADELEEDHKREQEDNEDVGGLDSEPSNFDILSEDNAMVTISGENYNLGHVVDRSRQVLGLNKLGFLFPLTLCVKHIVDAKGIQSFIGILRPQPENENLGYAIMNADLVILHFTKNLGTLFDTKPFSSDEVETRSKISDWIPSVTTEALAQVLSKTGLKAQHYSNGVLYDVTLHGDSVQVTGSLSYICRLKFKAENETDECLKVVSGAGVKDETIDATPIPKGCPFSDRNSAVPVITKPSVVDSRVLFQSEPQNRGAIKSAGSSTSMDEMPMSFSERGSHDDVSARSASVRQSEIAVFHGSHRRASYAGSELMRGFPANPALKKSVVITERVGFTVGISSDIAKPDSAMGPRFAVDSAKATEDDKEDKESVGSRGSKATTAKSYVKRVINRKNEKSNRRLQLLNYAFILCLAILSITSVFECVEYRKIYSSVSSMLEKILLKSHVALDFIQVADSVRSLDLRRTSGWFWSNASSLPLENIAKNDLDVESNRLRLTAGDFAFCLDPVNLRARSDNIPTRNLLPLEAISITIASARYLVGAPPNDRDQKEQADIVLSNAAYEMLRLVNSCSEADRTEVFRLGAYRPTEIIVISSIGPMICLIVLLFMVQPLYMRIEDNKERFLRMFYDIPKEAVKGIYESHFQRLVAAEEDEDGENEGEFSNRLALEKVLSSFQDISHGDKTSMSRSGSKRGGMLRSADSGQPSTNPIVRWFKKALNDHHKVVLKSFAILILSCINFFVIGALSYIYLSNIDEVGSSIYWTSQRPILVRQVGFLVRELFVDLVRNVSIARGIPEAQLPVPVDTSLIYQRIDALTNFIPILENGVVYGSHDLKLESAISHGYNDPYTVLELQNACVPLSPSDCATYQNGVMMRGLHSASAWFQKNFKAILENIANTSLSNSTERLAAMDLSLAAIKDLEKNYLFPAYDTASRHYLVGIGSNFNWLSTFNLAISVTFIVLLFGFYLLLVRPLIRGLGEDLKQTAALVYMLPAEVFSRVPSFKHWAEKHLDGTRVKDAAKEVKAV
ncbi:hypothetical protein HDU67_004369 [Dinochytrium kinnereticum]|nr:hypothetical protein HDU67_004369 [Dinochytrium kinnereticum]